VIGAGEDGSRVYFVADGVVGVNPGAVPGAPNLYVHEGGVTKLVVVLSPGDSPDWANGSENITGLAARVSAGGGWLVFMSDRSLTGYDNRDAVSGHLDEEVFLYNAVTRRISCVSCDPSGARPVGLKRVVKVNSRWRLVRMVCGLGVRGWLGVCRGGRRRCISRGISLIVAGCFSMRRMRLCRGM